MFNMEKLSLKKIKKKEAIVPKLYIKEQGTNPSLLP